jgi:4-diphosphocytidyl-2C-methyl-D-erythritol kinase
MPNAFARQLLQLAEVRYAREKMLSAGAPHVAITGAGPAVYTLVPSYREAARIAERLPRDVGTITLGRSIARLLDDRSVRAIARALRFGTQGH